jgi:uncharacterized protein YndB with AHSA1/START domain
MSKMTIKTEGDTHVVVTRRFAAPPEALYRAHTEPKLIQADVPAQPDAGQPH